MQFKYLKAEEFVKYCKSNNVEASLEALEKYEEADLLYPIYRLIEPDEFVRADFDTKYNPAPIPGIDSLTELLRNLQLYNMPIGNNLNQTLQKGHPLDDAYINKNPFLHKPSLSSFKPWKDYKIDVMDTRNRLKRKADTADHYYAPWQIFVLDAINYKNTILVNNITNRKTEYFDLDPLKLLKYSELFQTICDVAMKESLIHTDISLRSKHYIIEGDLFTELTNRVTEVQKKGYQNHPHKEWIRFLRKLVELHELYLGREKSKLASELKHCLGITINIILGATQKSFDDISDEHDGPYKVGTGIEDDSIIHAGELHRIFPTEIRQAKEHLGWLLPSNIEEFNKILPPNNPIPPETSEKLIDELIKNNQEIVLSHFHKIEDLWFHRELHWESSIWGHIRSFVISLDAIGGEWFRENYFNDTLDKAFPRTYGALKTSIENGITSADNLLEYKTKLESIIAHRKANKNVICGHHLVIACLTRNYLSHNISSSGIPDSLFIEIYQSLIFTLISLFVMKP